MANPYPSDALTESPCHDINESQVYEKVQSSVCPYNASYVDTIDIQIDWAWNGSEYGVTWAGPLDVYTDIPVQWWTSNVFLAPGTWQWDITWTQSSNPPANSWIGVGIFGPTNGFYETNQFGNGSVIVCSPPVGTDCAYVASIQFGPVNQNLDPATLIVSGKRVG